MRILLSTLLLAVILVPTDALAQTPSDLDDLVGERAGRADSELRNRGYVHIETLKGDDRAFSNWWNGSRHACVLVETMDGRFHNVSSAPSSDCNQHHAHKSNNDDAAGEAIGAAVAIGAAALLVGALASSDHHHKSHHHSDRRHRSDHDYEREFERGHRDGLYHHAHDNHRDTDAYRHGYHSGSSQRHHNTSHRHHSGRHNSSGYQQSVSKRQLHALRGTRSSSVEDRMSEWGFSPVDRYIDGDTTYLTWFSRSRGQCVEEVIQNGRVITVDESVSPSCR